MNRTLLLSLVVSAAAGGYLSALVANPPVDLQPATPGVAQTGNANVTGKVMAGKLEANDSGATGIAIVGNALHASGANYGGLFKTLSSTGTGIRGVSTATTGSANGGTFQSASPAGAGVRGFATAATGVNYGVYGKAVSPDGFAGYFVGRLQASGNAIFQGSIISGTSSFPGSSGRVQLYQDVVNSHGTLYVQNGVPTILYGHRIGTASQACGSGTADGVLASAQSTSGSPSYGVNASAIGSGVNYAVFGFAASGTDNWSGYFSGALYASSANAAVKAFMIDHPLDPENKVLYHSSVESSERMNLYRGTVTTDARGYASIAVPSWFDALNEDVMYQLTVIDTADSAGFTLAKVVQELKLGKFKIRTSVGNAKVSWLLTGRRHDPVSEHYPFEIERAKTAGERGKYYEPEAYGKDKSLGMGYVPGEIQRAENPPSAQHR